MVRIFKGYINVVNTANSLNLMFFKLKYIWFVMSYKLKV